VLYDKSYEYSRKQQGEVWKEIWALSMALPEPPATYTEEDYKRDNARLDDLHKIRANRKVRKLRPKEEAEAAALAGRVKSYWASRERLQDKVRYKRLMELDAQTERSLPDDLEWIGLCRHFNHSVKRAESRYAAYWAAVQSYDHEPGKPSKISEYWAAARAYDKAKSNES
jgi:hypothetical protein